ncbi:testisin-like [Cyprinodon tularosa]|uniref:testisin-like n=1 Tax=Cyprinodon tularosa TaxID=77115 RepID=UPI0018E20DD3|nr:testisin-like [Cyprinodon tularosa]
MSAPVNLTDYIQPVCLASEESTFYDGTASWVTSFGEGYEDYDPELIQEINASVFGNNKCRCFYKNSDFLPLITENTICAETENGSKDANYGDNGAPLVNKKGSNWVQSGISSYWYDDDRGQPTIYTLVSKYQKWMSDRVTGMEPGFVTFTSPGNDTNLNFTCPTPAPTTEFPYSTGYPYFTTEKSIFSSGEAVVPTAHVFSYVPCLLLHLFVGGTNI